MSIRSSVLISLVEKYFHISINIVTTIVLARLLAPDEIGVYSVGLSIVWIAHVFRDFGISTYLVQEPELTTDRIRTALGLSVCFGWPIAVILYFLSGDLAEFYGDPRLRAVLQIVAFNFVLLPIGAPAMSLLMRQMAFGTILRINLSSIVVLATVQIVLAYLGFGPVSLAWASLAQITTLSVLATIARPAEGWVLPSLKEWRRILSFGGLSSLTNLINYIGLNSTDLIVGHMMGMTAVGIYSRAQGLVYLFHRDVMGAIHQVALPAFAAQQREGSNLKEGYIRAVDLVTGFAWPFYAVIAVIAGPLIVTAFGPQWTASAPLAQTLAGAFAITSVWSLSRHILYATGHVKYLFISELVIQATWVVSVVIGAYFSLEMICILATPVALVGYVVHSYYMHRIIGISVLQSLSIFARNALIAAASALVPALAMYFLAGQEPNSVLLAVAVVGAGAGWIIAIFATNHPARSEILGARMRFWAARRARSS
jgi:O-antigen/teichoic acid export membrane protein